MPNILRLMLALLVAVLAIYCTTTLCGCGIAKDSDGYRAVPVKGTACNIQPVAIYDELQRPYAFIYAAICDGKVVAIAR